MVVVRQEKSICLSGPIGNTTRNSQLRITSPVPQRQQSMPKRKVEADDDDDEVEASHSEQEEEIKPKKAVKKVHELSDLYNILLTRKSPGQSRNPRPTLARRKRPQRNLRRNQPRSYAFILIYVVLTMLQTKKANPVSKAESDGEAVDAGEVVVHRNDEGEKYLDLGRNRRQV